MEPYNKSDSDQSDEVDEEGNKDQLANGTVAERSSPIVNKEEDKAKDSQAVATLDAVKGQEFCSIRNIELEVAAKEDEPAAAATKKSQSAALSDDGRASDPLDEKDPYHGCINFIDRIQRDTEIKINKMKTQRKNGSKEKRQDSSNGKLSLSAAKSEDELELAPSSPRSLGDPRSEQSEKHLGRSAYLLGHQDPKDMNGRRGVKPRANTSQFTLSSNVADQSDRVSNHSHGSAAALQDYIGGEDELVKDTGIFNVELNGSSSTVGAKPLFGTS